MKDWLVVREVSSSNVLARHWVQSKHRFCVLRDSVLSLRTSDTTPTSVGEYSLRYVKIRFLYISVSSLFF